MPICGIRLETNEDITQEEFDRCILKVKHAFKLKDIVFEDTIMSGYKGGLKGSMDVMEFIKVI